MKKITLLVMCLALLGASGCGYSNTSLLPPELDSIHVDNFVNTIDLAQTVSDRRASYKYWPGLETDITRAVIDGFIFDGNLTVESSSKAKMTLEGKLTDFKEFPLSYGKGGSVEEFRVSVTVDLKLVNNTNGEVMWTEDSFQGQSTYNINGPSRKTEAEAVRDTVRDLASRIVERVTEAW